MSPAQLVDEFARRFQQTHGMQHPFHRGRRRPAGYGSAGARTSPCATSAPRRFKDFHFGLKLIAQNSGQQEFVIDCRRRAGAGQGAERLGRGQLSSRGQTSSLRLILDRRPSCPFAAVLSFSLF